MHLSYCLEYQLEKKIDERSHMFKEQDRETDIFLQVIKYLKFFYASVLSVF